MKSLLYISFLIFLTGCKNNHCPGFPDESLDWIPYKKGDKITFVDGHDTLKFLVKSTVQISPYSAKSWPIEVICENIASAILINDSESSDIVAVGNFLNYQANSTSYTYSIGVKGNSLFGFLKDSTNNISTLYSSNSLNILSSFNNGYKEFKNVLELQIDTVISPFQPVNRIYIAKSVGLIQFSDYKRKKTWSLID